MNNVDWSAMTKLVIVGCAVFILSFLIFVSAARAETAECSYKKYDSGKEYIYNTQFPGGQCTLSCRYKPSYESEDQCSHGLDNLSDNNWRPNFSGNKRNNPF